MIQHVRRWIEVIVFAAAGCGSAHYARDARLSDDPSGAASNVQARVQAYDPSDGPLQRSGERRRHEMLITPVYFDFDSWALTRSAQKSLLAKAAVLTSDSAMRLRIDGHADERGSDAYNLTLSKHRASEARRFLMALQVPPERIDIDGNGEREPLCETSAEWCWSVNRRAEFTVVVP
jgi:peptidoglycan-associated lipoprotein